MTERDRLIAEGIIKPGSYTPNGEMLPEPTREGAAVLRLDPLAHKAIERTLAGPRWIEAKEVPT